MEKRERVEGNDCEDVDDGRRESVVDERQAVERLTEDWEERARARRTIMFAAIFAFPCRGSPCRDDLLDVEWKR